MCSVRDFVRRGRSVECLAGPICLLLASYMWKCRSESRMVTSPYKRASFILSMDKLLHVSR